MGGIQGHNRGKKMVPGVGYRYPTRRPKAAARCPCGRIAVYFSSDGEKLCEECGTREALEAVREEATR